MDIQDVRKKIRALMPEVNKDLRNLISHPSVAFPGYPKEPVERTADAVVDLLRRYGIAGADLLEIPGGYPAVYAEIPAPPGAPTVLMYAHYDVQPAPPEGWETDPWSGVEKDGRLYGRGAADDKAGILINAASVRAFDGALPVGVRLLIEGEEETAGHLEEFVRANPHLVQCDVFIVTDNGNLVAGSPVISTALRGEVSCILTVKTLSRAVHSGSFGGPAPDALISLIQILATLHDANGDVAVPGLEAHAWDGEEIPEILFRRTSGMLEGVDMIGTGTISSRLWSRPSVTVIGIDAPRIAGASNILVPAAAAAISMRIAPDADPDQELERLMDHLKKNAPWHVQVEVRKVSASPGFTCPTGGPAFTRAREAMADAFGMEVAMIGSGGSIPLVETLKSVAPGAEFILWGSEDMERSNIHGPNESVDLRDLEQVILAQVLFLQSLGKTGHD